MEAVKRPIPWRQAIASQARHEKGAGPAQRRCSKPAGNDLRWAAGVIEKYDAATIEDCHMIDSTDCAAILTALAEYRERFDSPTPKHSEPESVNADLKMGQNNQEKGVKAA